MTVPETSRPPTRDRARNLAASASVRYSVTPSDRLPAAARIHPEVIPTELVPDRRGVVSCLSSVTRSGDWILPRLFRTVTILGNVELDLTRARIGPGTSQIEVVAVMGSIEIIVPPDLRIECDGDPLMGSFEMKGDVRGTSSPDAPLVRITGTAFVGSVEVKVVDPNAPGWFEKLKRRLTSGE